MPPAAIAASNQFYLFGRASSGSEKRTAAIVFLLAFYITINIKAALNALLPANRFFNC